MRFVELAAISNALALLMYFHAAKVCAVCRAVLLLELVLQGHLINNNDGQSIFMISNCLNIEHSPGYDAFMLRLFLHAQYNANMAPLINEITKTANATPDIQVVAQPLTAGSVLFCERLKKYQKIKCLFMA